jgi:hypothetical protein
VKRAKLRAQKRGIWDPADLEKALAEGEAQKQAWGEWREFQARLQDEWQWYKEEKQWEIEQERKWEENDPVRGYN